MKKIRLLTVLATTIWMVTASLQGKAQIAPSKQNEKPVKVTWEIYSGRVSPYFQVSSKQEVREIESRLKDLPRKAPASKEQSLGAYMFELPGQKPGEVRLITVGESEIQIASGRNCYVYADAKSLRKYLDQLKTIHKLTSGDNLPIK